MMEIRRFTFNPFQENTYAVWDEDRTAVIIDPGNLRPEETASLMELISSEGLRPAAILLTHCHFDHIYGVAGLVGAFGVGVYAGEAESQTVEFVRGMAQKAFMPSPDTSWKFTAVSDGDVLTFGKLSFKVIGTPGHTAGGVCYLLGGVDLFSGDTLFAGTIGRTDLPGGDYDSLIVSVMENVMGLDGDVEVHPGHGGETNIGHERTHNPFLQPFNEKDEDSGELEGIEICGR